MVRWSPSWLYVTKRRSATDEPCKVRSMLTGELRPLFHSAEPRRRGRPPGTKAQVVRDTRFLGIHHFAFVRSSLLGLDLRDAFNRYLAWSETTTDLRYIQNRRGALLGHIIEAGRLLDATLPSHALSLIHISEPTRRTPISYAVF